MTQPALTAEEAAIVEANVGLVGFVLRRRRTSADEWDDRWQDGMLGLMRAAQKFDPTRGFAFSTCAMFWIRQAVGRGAAMFEGRSYRYAVEKGLDWQAPLSLDVPMTSEDGDTVTLATFLVADDDPASRATDHANDAPLVAAVMAACRDDLDRAIMLAIAQGTPLAAVAREFGVSPQTPRNRLRQVGSRLRHPAMRAAA